MSATNNLPPNLDVGPVLDNLGAGLLLFNHQDQLVLDNLAARRVLGTNLVLVRSEGWAAFSMLVDANPSKSESAQDIRTRALNNDDPVRFHMLLGGSYLPCWVSPLKGTDGANFTQVVIDNPDWTALTELMRTFRSEALDAINDTQGHAKFISNLLTKPPAGISAEDLGKKAMGMVNLISTEMHNMHLLVDLLHRLEIVRTGKLSPEVARGKQKIDMEDFLEDFLEELNEDALIDPAIHVEEYRDRLTIDADEDLYVHVPKSYLRSIMRDVLRNAFMYSEAPSPVKVRLHTTSQGRNIQFDITDEGCGVRAKETDRVFEPFQRARQPQVIREHGYGLSLYLCRAEIEAMGGRMWYESEEGVGSTFSFKLPAYIKS